MRFLLPAIFAGVVRSEVEETTPAQRRVLQAVAERPGLTMSALARKLEVSLPTIDHHIAKLVAAQRLHTVVAGRTRLVFAGPAGPSHDEDVELALLRHPSARRLAACVVERPGMSARTLWVLTGLSRRALYHHLHRLTEADLLRTAKPDRYGDITASERLHVLLAKLD